MALSEGVGGCDANRISISHGFTPSQAVAADAAAESRY